MKSKRRTLVFSVSALLLLAAGSTAAISSQAADEELPPTPPWVNSDGTIDSSAVPNEVADLLADGRPNGNDVLEPDLSSRPVEGGTNPPGVTSTEDPAEPDTEILEWEVPEPSCAAQVASGTGGSTSLNVCKITGQTAANGTLRDTVSDGKCVTVRISIATYTGSWTACDGQNVKLDTGYRDGSAVQYAWSLR